MSDTCFECQKSFPSQQALEQHKKSKHNTAAPISNRENKKSSKKMMAWGIILVLILAFGYWILSAFSGPGKYDTFAKCIADSGAKFYGAFWCTHCQDQKNLFGSSKKYLPYIECSTPDRSGQLAECSSIGIEGYPTWIFPDNSRTNFLSLAELSRKTSCPLP